MFLKSYTKYLILFFLLMIITSIKLMKTSSDTSVQNMDQNGRLRLKITYEKIIKTDKIFFF